MHPDRLLTYTLRNETWGCPLAQVMAAALQAVDPYQAVQRFLSLEGEDLIAGERRVTLSQVQRIFVVGAGKAGLPMTRAVVDLLGERISAGQVTVKDGHNQGIDRLGNIRIAEAAHPLPDQRGLASTQQILSLLSDTTAQDLVVCLISGGGSALLTAPLPGISLEDMRALTQALLASGATIQEVNTLRQALDTVKGGGLARAAAPAQVLTLVLSDVVGDPMEMIASGPTVSKGATAEEVQAVLTKYDLLSQLPPNIQKALCHPPAPQVAPPQVHNLLVGSNELAAQAAIVQAGKLGWSAELLTTTLQGEAGQVGRQMAADLCRRADDPAQARPLLLVAGGETTVTLRGDGHGGRNQELALAAVQPLAKRDDLALVTLATDGGDGPTDAAGAVVTGDTLARAQALNLDPEAYLTNHDSYTFFSMLGDNLKPGPTHTNVNDLLFMLVLE